LKFFRVKDSIFIGWLHSARPRQGDRLLSRECQFHLTRATIFDQCPPVSEQPVHGWWRASSGVGRAAVVAFSLRKV